MSHTGPDELLDDWPDTVDDDVGAIGTDVSIAGFGVVLFPVIEVGPGGIRGWPSMTTQAWSCSSTLFSCGRAHSDNTEPPRINPSAKMLEPAHSKHRAANLIQADVSREMARVALPAFDAIVSASALHGLPDDRILDLP
jgi:hypothetical protein